MRDALEIQDSVARPIDTVTYALDDVVYKNECELLATVSLPKIGISVCSYYSCWSTVRKFEPYSMVLFGTVFLA